MRRFVEIEFVCVNSEYSNATPLERQEALFRDLQQLASVFVYRQDFSDEFHTQVSMAAIPFTVKAELEVYECAKKHGVEIDLVDTRSYSESELNRLIRDVESGEIPNPVPSIPLPKSFLEAFNNKNIAPRR